MDSEKYPIHKYIYEWLLDHESIIVPDLGQFVAEFKGASIHPSIHSISPPNKTIVFKDEPKYDDGELSGFITQKENISNEEASDLVKQFVAELKIALASEQTYELPSFGVFSRTESGDIEFAADDAINFAGDSFGTPKLFYKPLEKKPEEKEGGSFFDQDFDTTDEKPLEKVAEVNSSFADKDSSTSSYTANDDHVKTPFDDDDDDDLDDDDFDDDERRRPKWIMPVVAILAAGVIITAGVVFIPKMLGGGKSQEKTEKTDSTKQVAENNTDTSTTTSTEVQLDDTTNQGGTSGNNENTTSDNNNTTSGNDNGNSGTSTTTSDDNNTSSNTTPNTTTTTPSYTPPPANTGGTTVSAFRNLPYRPQTPGSGDIINSPTSKFYIIVASFSTRANAYSLYNNLKAQGYSAKVIPPIEGSPMHRVASGSYDSEDDANRNMRRLSSRLGSDIWVKKY